MATVDNRIVEMTFNNSEFERRTADTIKSLNALDKSISTVGASNGLSAIGTAAEGISSKFLAMSTIAVTALARLTNAAIDYGGRMLSALSLDPIMQGFQEYELNMNSIQTILANTERAGTTLQDVTASLDELNLYADQTIYNFAEMTKNIGLFTNAGIGIEEATSMIKGFSNVAAASGTSSAGAAGAAYQLSQALSAGTIRLMDWRSLTNVGMGNKNMQNDLVAIAEAMGVLNEAGISATEIQENFNASLETNWLSADVMSNYLQIMAGDMDHAAQSALGLTDAQIEGFDQAAATALEAATKVRTLTQLWGVMQESIGSGWMETFRIVLGDFNEATELFTGMQNAIGGYLDKVSSDRNELLQGWKDLGGRDDLIAGLAASLKNVLAVLKPVKEAFRAIFPAMTAERLATITRTFRELAEGTKPSAATLENITRIFTGLFNILKTGFGLIKIGVGAVKDLVVGFAEFSGGGILDVLAAVGDALAGLSPEGIISGFQNLFSQLVEIIQDPLPYIRELGEGIADFFRSIDLTAPDLGFLNDLFGSIRDFFSNFGLDLPNFPAIELPLGRIGDRIEHLQGVFESARDNLFRPLAEGFGKVKDVLADAYSYIAGFFDGTVSTIESAASDGDYSGVADALSIGLLGAIGVAIGKLLKDGINIDFTGGVIESVKGMFEGLTETLGAMQAKLKSEALLNIAYAIGALTASVVVLSLIDSEALAKALTAMAVGFGQLLASFAVIQSMQLGPSTAGKFAAIAVGLTLLSGAALLLAAAGKIMSTLNWGEISRGLTGVAGILASLVVTAQLLKANAGTLSGLGLTLMGVGVAMVILASAMKIFASMDWEEIVKGLIGVVGGLTGIGLAFKLYPSDMAAKTAGLIGLSVAMGILSIAMRGFAGMDWEEIGKGLIGVGFGLAAITASLESIPEQGMIRAGIAIGIVSAAMILLADAIAKFGTIEWGALAKGVVAMTTTLVVLSAALDSMKGTLGGGVALFLLVNSLEKFTGVIKSFAKLSIGTVAKGLIVIATSLGALAGVAYLIGPAIPALLGLGAAMILLGAGVGAFGIGVAAAVGALVTLNEIGPGVGDTITEVLKAVGAAIPTLAAGLAEGLLLFGESLLSGIPLLVEIVANLINALLTKAIELLPKFGEFAIELIGTLLSTLRTAAPDMINTGLEIILAFLQGLAQNTESMATAAVQIIAGLIDGIAAETPNFVDSVVNFLTEALTSVAHALGELSTTLGPTIGVAFLEGMLDGLDSLFPGVKQWFLDFIDDVIDWVKSGFGIFSPSRVFSDIGKFLMSGLLNGLVSGVVAVTTWFIGLPGRVLGWIGDVTGTLIDKGKNLLSGLYNGITQAVSEVTSFFTGLASDILGWIGDVASSLWQKGVDLLVGLGNGIVAQATNVANWLAGLGGMIVSWVGDIGNILWGIGSSIFTGLLNGMKSAWNTTKDWLGGIGGAITSLKGPPEKDAVLLVNNGMLIMQGLQKGMSNEWDHVAKWLGGLDPSKELNASAIGFAMQKSIDGIVDMANMNPVITPVIDLSQVRAGASELATLIGSGNYATAASIAGTRSINANPDTASGSEIQFIQNNNSPKALSTADIYRQTRTQLAIAKEELKI